MNIFHYSILFLCGVSTVFGVIDAQDEPRCTTWIDRDNPSGKCDCEDMFTPARIKEVRNFLSSCDTCDYVIQARLKGGTNIYENPAQALADTGNTIDFIHIPQNKLDSEFSRAGIRCWNNRKGQPRQKCKDFEVRYCCKNKVKGCNPKGKRINCPMKPAPISIISEEACLKRNCCWDASPNINMNLWCYQNAKKI